MITLNLLSPDKKQSLRLTETYQTIKNLIILILLLTIITAIVLLVTKLALQNHFTRIVSESTLTIKYVSFFSQDIKEFNKQLKAVENIQSEHIAWTNFFISFAQLVPDNIGLDNLTINENKILITGFAKTRDDLIEFQNNIKNSSLFSEVTVPLENLLKKDDVDFDIKANINLEEI